MTEMMSSTSIITVCSAHITGTVGVVSNVLSTEVIDTSFSVQWFAADAGGSNFQITRYIVDVLKDGTLVKSVVIGGDQTRAKIDGLKANTTYEVKIFARNGNGFGNPSVVLTVRTEEAKKDDESGTVLILSDLYVILQREFITQVITTLVLLLE